ncbi:hypothetical protein [Pseudanabaena yagii]|uniref:Uncharacterized protein n=1 Tax=Pseudanabaena yagii GIHE-NHR1 TaxID=2722753 RepID=A0ABX1M0U7_9CYAN|nr:hypothetical protein [Pseudanabaena yagii]NMF60821.1 hypothetical protein [Pseudanabaena yagii GIHE-NHR1]
MFKKDKDSKDKATQSISIGGGTFTNSPIAQAGGDLQISQQIVQSEANSGLTVDEVLGLIDRFAAIIRESDLSEKQKEKVLRHVASGKDEVHEKEPDKELVKQDLQRATKVIKDVDEAVSAGQGLWQKLEPVVTKLASWLGVAVSTFWA